MGRKSRFNWKKFILISFFLLGVIIFSIISTKVVAIINNTPSISNYSSWKPTRTTMIYSADGKLLSRFYEENRIYEPLSKIPKSLQNAIVSIEDSRFYQHYGIDLQAIARALWIDIKKGEIVQGGSTITQQLAKNALLTHKRTLYRKIQEAYLAIQFERKYTKKEILEFYLNEIYLGDGIYGVKTAAKYYFNKDVQDLTLAESALIAGLPKAPNYYSPYNNLEIAKERRNIVLSQMVKYGYITKAEAKKAKKKPIKLENGLKNQQDLAPYFVRYIRKKLINMYGPKSVYNSGLKVYTSLNYSMQKKAKEAINQAFKEYIPSVKRKEGKGLLQPQVALVTIEPETGNIKTMIGGRGEDSKYNRVTQAYRQPGSAFKPFVYTTAIKQGFSPGSVIDDTLKGYKVGFNNKKKWIPKNYNDKYLGPTTLRIGLAKSINVMAVKLLDKVGVGNTIQTAREMGISSLVTEGSKNDKNLALALGGLTKGVNPLEITSAYGVLANQGIKVEPVAILKIVDSRGNIIFKNDPQKEIILEKDVSYLVNDMLQSVLARGPIVWGTGWRANLDRPAFGKTGTTSNYTDAWFIGYTPNLVTGVWIGEDLPVRMEYKVYNQQGQIIKDKEDQPKTNIVSSAETARLWGDYMKQITKSKPIKDYYPPDNIIIKNICLESGLLPNQYCPQDRIRGELFIAGTEPIKECNLHYPTVKKKIDIFTNKLATKYCPEENVEVYSYQKNTKFRVDDNGVPIKKFNPETKLPLRDKEGNYIYKKMPQQKCQLHTPDSIDDMIGELIEQLKNNIKGEE